jgi:starch synthase
VTSRPRIVAIAPGAPFDPETWSGISASLLGRLRERGALADAVEGRPRALTGLEKLVSLAPNRTLWRQTYNAGASPLGPGLRIVAGRLGARRARRAAADADATLQLTGWFRAACGRRRPPGLCCAYHDGNLAVFLRRPDLAIEPRSRWVRRALESERRLHEETDLILPMSEWLRRSFIEDFRQDPGKVVAVGAGANVASAKPPATRDFERPRILFVGKQFQRKGGPQVVKAFRQVRRAYPSAELWIVGPTGLRLQEPGVRVIGRIARDREGQARLDRLFREATAFVMPSLYEPFGVAFLEAMAYGLPSVGSSACAIPEIVEDDVTGWTVSPGDSNALADRICALASDPPHAERMGAAGRRRYLERFTWDAVADRILATIHARLGERER